MGEGRYFFLSLSELVRDGSTCCFTGQRVRSLVSEPSGSPGVTVSSLVAPAGQPTGTSGSAGSGGTKKDERPLSAEEKKTLELGYYGLVRRQKAAALHLSSNN